MAKTESAQLHAETRDIVLRLSAYLSDNPLACDSVDGITQWWLAGAAGSAVVHPALLDALEQLETCQVIERQTAADGRTRFRRTAVDADFQARVQRVLGAARPDAQGEVH